jgi:hypothetical protein
MPGGVTRRCCVPRSLFASTGASDLDLCCVVDGDTPQKKVEGCEHVVVWWCVCSASRLLCVQFIYRFSRDLGSRQYRNVQPIAHAKVPIVKATFPEAVSDMNFDLCINNTCVVC